MVVLPEYRGLKGNVRFGGQRAKVVQAKSGAVGCIGAQHPALVVDHIARVQALQPGIRADAWKALRQKVDHQRPRPGGQHHATGTHAVSAGGRVRPVQRHVKGHEGQREGQAWATGLRKTHCRPDRWLCRAPGSYSPPRGHAVPSVGVIYLHPLKHHIPHTVPELDAAVLELGQRAVVGLGCVAIQLRVGGQRAVLQQRLGVSTSRICSA
jgi:hypothetical protein